MIHAAQEEATPLCGTVRATSFEQAERQHRGAPRLLKKQDGTLKRRVQLFIVRLAEEGPEELVVEVRVAPVIVQEDGGVVHLHLYKRDPRAVDELHVVENVAKVRRVEPTCVRHETNGSDNEEGMWD